MYMKKPILLLSFASCAIAAGAVVLLISFLTVFWEPMCFTFSGSQNIIATGPILPSGTMIYMVGCFFIAATACVFTNFSRSIVFEIIAIVLLAIVIPILEWSLSMAQTIEIAQTMGDVALAALSATRQIGNFASGLMAVSEALCLVVCGMSICKKCT